MRVAVLAAIVVLSGCLAKAPPEEAGPSRSVAPEGPLQAATLTTVYAGGVGREVHGYAFVPSDDLGSLVVFVRGLKEGGRAVHVHEAPSCRSSVEGDKTVAAGESGPRWGDDLPDLAVDAGGDAALAAPFAASVAGRSLVVHAIAEKGEAGEEDAGPAVLCGVFEVRSRNETAAVLGALRADMPAGGVELSPLFDATYARVAFRGLAQGTYLLTAADRDTCEGAAATAREPWTSAPRLHVAADGTVRAAWVLAGDAASVRGTPVMLQKDGEGRAVACAVVAPTASP